MAHDSLDDNPFADDAAAQSAPPEATLPKGNVSLVGMFPRINSFAETTCFSGVFP